MIVPNVVTYDPDAMPDEMRKQILGRQALKTFIDALRSQEPTNPVIDGYDALLAEANKPPPEPVVITQGGGQPDGYPKSTVLALVSAVELLARLVQDDA